MRIDAVNEFNMEGHLIYSSNFIGAYVRGKTREEALNKFASEIVQYCYWLDIPVENNECTVSIIQEKQSNLQICDADSDVLFDSEIEPLTVKEYENLRDLALKSAKDFEMLYRSIPIKNKALLPSRKTFYGMIPTTADEMYEHTKNVNDYYFREIHIPAENEPNIYICRLRAFEKLENRFDFLQNRVYDGIYGELWSLRKVCRRFVWHDRIHAKAMYRSSVKLWNKDSISNPFCFAV